MSSSQKNPVSKPNEDDPDWQSQKLTPVDRAKHMLDTGLFSDLEFLVGDTREIFKAHKNFLAMTSPVFETMFFGSVPQPQPVVIPDIQPEIFKELLQYIYTDMINLEAVEDAYSLYYSADKYMLPNLSDRCIQYLKDNLSPKNVFRALEFGTLRENEALKESCLAMLSLQMYSSYETDNTGFDELSESSLLAILQLGTMDMSELELFHAVEGWAGRQCSKKNVELNGPNKRKELSNAIIYIRFLSMTSREFASSPARSGILSESECFAVFMKLNSRENWPLPFSLSAERKSRGYKGDDGWDQFIGSTIRY